MAIRLTGGQLRSRILAAPKGRAVRPTSGRVREAIFSIIGQDHSGARVLDLCAGAGSLGIEAGSRGAERVVFVEQSRDHLRVLRENAKVLDGIAAVDTRQGDARSVLKLLARQGAAFDVVFLDPPYGTGLAAEVLGALAVVSGTLLATDAVIVVEEQWGIELPTAVGEWECEGPRKYGDTGIWFYREAAERQETGE